MQPEGKLIFAAQVGRPIDSPADLKNHETQKTCAYCRHLIAVGPEDPEMGEVVPACQACTFEVMQRISNQIHTTHAEYERQQALADAAERKIRRLLLGARVVYWIGAVVFGLFLVFNLQEGSWGWAAFDAALLAVYLRWFVGTWSWRK